MDEQAKENRKLIWKAILRSLLGFFLLIILFGSWYVVNPWQRAFTVKLWSINDTVYSNGLHMKLPLIASVVKFDIQTQKLTTQATASSKDLQSVTADLAINYAINPKSVITLFKSVGNMDTIENRIINPIIQEAIKSATAKYTAEELITKRESVSKDTITTLQTRLAPMGIDVSALNIINFEFSADFNTAIEQKVKAEQEALTQKNVLARKQYEAEQIVVTAKAQAESIAIQAQAINSQGWADYVKIKRVEKRDGKLPVYTLGSNMSMFMDIK